MVTHWILSGDKRMNYIRCETCYEELEIELEYVGIKRDEPRDHVHWMVCQQCGKNNPWTRGMLLSK